MKAVAIEKYGGPEVLRAMDLPRPILRSDDVLIEVHATSVNPVDWKIRRGLMKERTHYDFPLILGWDVAGIVKEAGPEARTLRPGDAVYGRPDITRNGAYAEFAAVRENLLVPKPRELSFEEASALPLAGQTALQALEAAGLRSGHKILIHGGAGGVGSLAIQMAKAKGARVAATASGGNREFVESLGADTVVDYQTEDFTGKLSDYDVVLDTVGGDVLKKSPAVLKAGGIVVSIVEKPDSGKISDMGKRSAYVFLEPDRKKMTEITKLIESGAMRPVISGVFPLDEARRAQEISEGRHARGKLVLRVR
jgi:NADPH:quinone reductase-like Zn-dependent oxidoreductase